MDIAHAQCTLQPFLMRPITVAQIVGVAFNNIGNDINISDGQQKAPLFSEAILFSAILVGWARLELATNGLKVRCSNQLSYQPQARYYYLFVTYLSNALRL